MTTSRRPLADYLAIPYRFGVIAGDPDEGGYVIEFPDLPGCMTSIESLDELVAMANEIREVWLETAYDLGLEIPEPSYPETHSGKFNVRLPKTLHRQLARQAAEEGVSLNQHVVALLAAGNAARTVAAGVERLTQEVTLLRSQASSSGITTTMSGAHSPDLRQEISWLEPQTITIPVRENVIDFSQRRLASVSRSSMHPTDQAWRNVESTNNDLIDDTRTVG